MTGRLYSDQAVNLQQPRLAHLPSSTRLNRTGSCVLWYARFAPDDDRVMLVEWQPPKYSIIVPYELVPQSALRYADSLYSRMDACDPGRLARL